jgi:hypothetical protein
MKITLGRVSVYVGVSVKIAEKPAPVVPSKTYFSRSCNTEMVIAKMETTHIKNAVLKMVGLADLRFQPSEIVVKELSHIRGWDSESYGLYRELKSRVDAQIA